MKRMTIEVPAEEFDDKEDAEKYAGSYVIKRLDPFDIARIQDQSAKLDRRSGAIEVKTGIYNMEQLIVSIVDSPIGAGNDFKKNMKGMPPALYYTLLGKVNEINTMRLSDEDRKNL